MAFVKKTWQARISEYPNRRTITDENGVTKPVTVGRAEGVVTQEGDGFTASNMNDLEQRIYNAFSGGGGGGGSADIISTASGTIATFNDGGDNIPLKSCEVAIPANTQGISSVNIGVNGKNFYPLKVGLDLFTNNRSASHTTNDDILSITMDSQNNSGVYGGTGGSVNNQICQTIKKFSGNFVLSLYAKASADNKDVYFGFQSFYSTVVTLSTSWQRIELPMTLDGNIHILNFYNRSGSAITVDVKDIQIELGQTATEYEDFVGDNYSISLGETLTQGGTLEAVSGLLTRADTTTSQLTGAKIPTLSGLNNIYSNTGDVSVEYFNENADQMAELVNVYPYEVSGILATGQTSIILSSGLIKTTSTIDVYTDGGVNYNSIFVANGSVTITFDAQASNLGVKVRVS